MHFAEYICKKHVQVGKEMVAVKIFPLQDKQSWFAEHEIYNLPQVALQIEQMAFFGIVYTCIYCELLLQLSHDNILQFLGVNKRGEGLQVQNRHHHHHCRRHLFHHYWFIVIVIILRLNSGW